MGQTDHNALRTPPTLATSPDDRRKRLRESAASEFVQAPGWEMLGLILRIDEPQPGLRGPTFSRRTGLSRKFIREETSLPPRDDLLEYVTHFADMAVTVPEQLHTRPPIALRATTPGLGEIPQPPRNNEPAIVEKQSTASDAVKLANEIEDKSPKVAPRRFVDARYRDLRNEILSHIKVDGPMCLGLIDMDDEDSTLQLYTGLAAALGDRRDAESPVLLVDASLVERRLSRSFAAANLPGLGEHVLEEVSLDDVLVPTNWHGISLLPCGGKRPRELREVNTTTWDELFAQLKQRFPYILVEFSRESTLAGTLAQHLSCMQVCVRLNRTPRERVTQLIRRLEREGVRDLGCILADLPRAA